MQAPHKVPETGFYYHYKHDPNGEVYDYAYEVIGVGAHTEDDCRPDDKFMVVYRPLYESSVFKAGRLFDIRPLEMWMGNVTKNEKTFPRFQKIKDQEVIAKLLAVRLNMYGRWANINP